MRVLLVWAHPEPKSFNAALREVAVRTLQEQGHVVTVSDLYAQGFKAVGDRDDFLTVHDSERFNLSLEQRHACKCGGLAPDIALELDLLQRADLLLLQFPLWWFGMPAILKGWIDRVFVAGAVYGRSATFDHGKFCGKRALVCVTTGAPAHAFGPGGINGDLLDLLAPLHRGVLGFTGMTVLPPFFGFEVPYVGAEVRSAMLEGYRRHLHMLDVLEPLPMPRVADHPEMAPRPAAR